MENEPPAAYQSSSKIKIVLSKILIQLWKILESFGTILFPNVVNDYSHTLTRTGLQDLRSFYQSSSGAFINVTIFAIGIMFGGFSTLYPNGFSWATEPEAIYLQIASGLFLFSSLTFIAINLVAWSDLYRYLKLVAILLYACYSGAAMNFFIGIIVTGIFVVLKFVKTTSVVNTTLNAAMILIPIAYGIWFINVIAYTCQIIKQKNFLPSKRENLDEIEPVTDSQILSQGEEMEEDALLITTSKKNEGLKRHKSKKEKRIGFLKKLFPKKITDRDIIQLKQFYQNTSSAMINVTVFSVGIVFGAFTVLYPNGVDISTTPEFGYLASSFFSFLTSLVAFIVINLLAWAELRGLFKIIIVFALFTLSYFEMVIGIITMTCFLFLKFLSDPVTGGPAAISLKVCAVSDWIVLVIYIFYLTWLVYYAAKMMAREYINYNQDVELKSKRRNSQFITTVNVVAPAKPTLLNILFPTTSNPIVNLKVLKDFETFYQNASVSMITVTIFILGLLYSSFTTIYPNGFSFRKEPAAYFLMIGFGCIFTSLAAFVSINVLSWDKMETKWEVISAFYLFGFGYVQLFVGLGTFFNFLFKKYLIDTSYGFTRVYEIYWFHLVGITYVFWFVGAIQYGKRVNKMKAELKHVKQGLSWKIMFRLFFPAFFWDLIVNENDLKKIQEEENEAKKVALEKQAKKDEEGLHHQINQLRIRKFRKENYIFMSEIEDVEETIEKLTKDLKYWIHVKKLNIDLSDQKINPTEKVHELQSEINQLKSLLSLMNMKKELYEEVYLVKQINEMNAQLELKRNEIQNRRNPLGTDVTPTLSNNEIDFAIMECKKKLQSAIGVNPDEEIANISEETLEQRRSYNQQTATAMVSLSEFSIGTVFTSIVLLYKTGMNFEKQVETWYLMAAYVSLIVADLSFNFVILGSFSKLKTKLAVVRNYIVLTLAYLQLLLGIGFLMVFFAYKFWTNDDGTISDRARWLSDFGKFLFPYCYFIWISDFVIFTTRFKWTNISQSKTQIDKEEQKEELRTQLTDYYSASSAPLIVVSVFQLSIAFTAFCNVYPSGFTFRGDPEAVPLLLSFLAFLFALLSFLFVGVKSSDKLTKFWDFIIVSSLFQLGFVHMVIGMGMLVNFIIQKFIAPYETTPSILGKHFDLLIKIACVVLYVIWIVLSVVFRRTFEKDNTKQVSPEETTAQNLIQPQQEFNELVEQI
ncbi:hypothetical protein BC833DRAFT_604347 [Globomyces pollinis-pini]|nr:hypothetical protein BC833DRAFT_604347 [Globomyces pollinis-pini]